MAKNPRIDPQADRLTGVGSRELEADERALLAKYATEVAAFRKFYIQNADDPVFEEINFSPFSKGFFIALGVVGDSGTGESFFDAFSLARICRYNLQYWDGELL